jgi:hypothetical protein
MGFVQRMNTVHKITLVTMVARGGGRGGSDGGNGYNDAMVQPNACITIVDLVLEKVLTTHTNVRKGSTTKQRTEEDAASGLAQKR